jgi:cyanophycinase-like exopeptidase
MATSPRLLVIMGSGETTPTMSRVHRGIVERLGSESIRAVLVDTPYGFQENAREISDRAVEYFRDAVGLSVEVASLLRSDLPPLEHDTAMARIRSARFVFSGPGSPSYALSVWAGTPVPALLAQKLAAGGAVTFASAAALTLGRLTVPVYEIYKAGYAPHWLDGLDLLGPLGLGVAVIPHYDNAEGGTHDTRFCYLGERRLAMLERALPDDAFILGVDGHTALVLDLDAREATVAGLGSVTVRRAGRSTLFPTGSAVAIDDLVSASRRACGVGRPSSSFDPEPRPSVLEPDPRSSASGAPAASGAAGRSTLDGRSPFREEVESIEQASDVALERRDAAAAVSAILEMDRALVAWSRDTEQSGEIDHARAVHRSMIVRLGEMAVEGARDPRAAIAPLVDVLVELRAAARAARDWAKSDRIRDGLLEAGVELRDSPGGTEWLLVPRLTSAAAKAGTTAGTTLA